MVELVVELQELVSTLVLLETTYLPLAGRSDQQDLVVVAAAVLIMAVAVHSRAAAKGQAETMARTLLPVARTPEVEVEVESVEITDTTETLLAVALE
jgi:hypothetical protein